MAAPHDGALVDSEEGLDLDSAEWPPRSWIEVQASRPLDSATSTESWDPPNSWFDDEPAAPAPVAFEAPMVGEPQAAPAPDDWQPEEWFQPQGLEPVQQFLDDAPGQEPLIDPYAPDAVSGGVQPARQVEPEQDVGDLLAPGMSTEEAAAVEADRQTAMPPEQRAAEQAQQDAQRSRDLGQRQLDELTEIQGQHDDTQQVWAARNAELQKERDAVGLELQQLSKHGINNDHWWESRSTGQKVASYLTAIIGGLLAPHRGGKNSGIEFIMDAINQDIGTQQANLQHRRGVLSERRGLVGELAAQNNDVLRSADTARVAALQSLDAQLAAEASQYDPAGTTARRIAEARVAVRQKQGEAAQVLEQKMYDRHKDAAEMDLKLRAERRAGAAQKLASKAHAREEARYQSEHGVVYDDKGGRYNPDPNAPAPTLKPSDQKTLEEIRVMREGAQVKDSRGQVIGEALGGAAGGDEMRKDVAGYEEFRTALADVNDRIASTVRKYGGLGSDRWKPEDVAAIEALHKPLVFKLARAMNGPGPLSQADVDAAKGSVPTLDTWTTSRKPGAVYDAMVGKADTEINKRLGVQLREWDPSKSPTNRYQALDRLRATAGEEAPREELVKNAMTPISGLTKQDPDMRSAALRGRANTFDALADRENGLSPEERDTLRDQIVAEVQSGDLTAKEASQLLNGLHQADKVGIGTWRRERAAAQEVARRHGARGHHGMSVIK